MTKTFADSTFVDTHVHLDDPAFDADRDVAIAEARHVGVSTFINIGYEPERWETSRVLREMYEGVEISLGLHPALAADFNAQVAANLIRTVQNLHPIAIGETGFDFSRPSPSHAEQERAFRAQLELAAEEGLPTIVHQRDAADALMAALHRWEFPAPVVLHSFDGPPRLVEWAGGRGCYIGIGGLATKRGSGQLREALRKVPTNRLLLETDAPYLPPPGAASRRNTPANLPFIAGILAPLWDLEPGDLARVTTANARALFRLNDATSRRPPSQ